MFKKAKADNFYLYGTEVDNFFISDFMCEAPGEYVKAYLLGLMYAQLDLPLDFDSICRQLDMKRETLDECFSYWEEKNAIRRVNDKNDPDGRYVIEYINLRELAFGGGSCAKREESILDDHVLSKLYSDVQSATGRILSSSEMESICAFITEYEISPELILYCYRYCAVNRRTSAGRYVSKVLLDWKSRGIVTVKQADEYLDDSDARYADYKTIFTELGFSRNPTAEEKRVMNVWFAKGKSLNEILEACKKTIRISNPNIKYVDKILMSGDAADKKQQSESLAAKINKLYEQTRKENEKKTAELRAQVLKKVPRIAEISEQIKAAVTEQTSAMLKRNPAAIDAARAKIKALQDQKKALLISAGFSPDAMDNIYSCKKCKDTGVLEDGTMCSCYREKAELINGKK